MAFRRQADAGRHEHALVEKSILEVCEVLVGNIRDVDITNLRSDAIGEGNLC